MPGQVFYDASRKLIKGVDGVVFVTDSQVDRLDANLESLDNLRDNLAAQGYDLDKLPIKYNDGTPPNAVHWLFEVRDQSDRVPDFEAVATTSEGVFETLKSVAKHVLVELKKADKSSSDPVMSNVEECLKRGENLLAPRNSREHILYFLNYIWLVRDIRRVIDELDSQARAAWRKAVTRL